MCLEFVGKFLPLCIQGTLVIPELIFPVKKLTFVEPVLIAKFPVALNEVKLLPDLADFLFTTVQSQYVHACALELRVAPGFEFSYAEVELSPFLRKGCTQIVQITVAFRFGSFTFLLELLLRLLHGLMQLLLRRFPFLLDIVFFGAELQAS